MLLIASDRDALLFVLSHEGGIILRIYKGIRNSAMSPDLRETRKAAFLGLGIGRNRSGRGPHGDQLYYCSQFKAQIQNL